MKRKVIQIAGSTQLVSLPRQWAKAHNIMRGQEIEVQEDGNKVIISADNVPVVNKVEFNLIGCQSMVTRIVGALYRKGVDELKLVFDDPQLLKEVNEALTKDTVGFEMLEQGNDYCIVKYVAGNIEEFDPIMRRTFLLLNNMADETAEAFKTAQYARLANLALLEESNNRFTTICKRYLNKNRNSTQLPVGPLYHVVEELEKIADQYKYICQHFSNLGKTVMKIDKNVLNTFLLANGMMRTYYELFYKFDKEKILALKTARNKVIEEVHTLFSRKMGHQDYWLTHHSVVLANIVFELVGSCLVINL